MPFNRRLQLRLDEVRYRRVAAAAAERGTSMAAVIRDAIDRALADHRERKREAAAAILTAEPMPVPKTVEELNAEGRGRIEEGIAEGWLTPATRTGLRPVQRWRGSRRVLEVLAEDREDR
jgi:hypothetical protein